MDKRREGMLGEARAALRRSVRDNGAGIDLLSLNVMEGKICWDLYIEGLVINADGNLYIEGLQIDLIALCQLRFILG
ncbi:hypothetical protein Syun_017342 [Stephania yunnanensis]|uniref:Uncharacterized protein n=1 Tax=Stephania yunnanensis TaxID=152371 RepID=A0AAP0P4Z3_9MAGN